jgi:hypothetical protein
MSGKEDRVLSGVTVKQWQKMPSQFLSEYCQKKQRPKANYNRVGQKGKGKGKGGGGDGEASDEGGGGGGGGKYRLRVSCLAPPPPHLPTNLLPRLQ